jgi:aryl sulfotransferase
MKNIETEKDSRNGAQFGWLASYPKSGNTWMRMMLRSLRNNGAPVDINESDQQSTILSRSDFEEFFGAESSDLTQNEIDAVRPALHRAMARASKESLILRKVHDRCWFTASGEPVFPPEVSRGAVYIVRDPRDVAVSAAHHFHIDVEESVRQMGNSNRIIARSSKRLETQLSQPLGSWSEHVVSWLDHAVMPVLLVRYEDMLVDSTKELARVVEFLGLSRKFNREACAIAAAQSDFTKLRQQEEEGGFKEKPPAATTLFFRQGRSGEGKKILPPSLTQKIVLDHSEAMARLGYL